MLDLEPLSGTDYATREDCLAAFYSGQAFLFHPFEEPIEELTIDSAMPGDVIQFRHHNFAAWFRIYLTPCMQDHMTEVCSRCGNWEFVPKFFNRRTAHFDKERTPFWQASKKLSTSSSGQA
jgi:hypothetical protein